MERTSKNRHIKATTAILGLMALLVFSCPALAASASCPVNLIVADYMVFSPNPSSVAVSIAWHAAPTLVYIGGTINCNRHVNIAVEFTPPNGSPPTTCTWSTSLSVTSQTASTQTYGTTSGNYLVRIRVDFDKNGVDSGHPYTFPALTVSQHASATPPAGNLYITLSAS